MGNTTSASYSCCSVSLRVGILNKSGRSSTKSAMLLDTTGNIREIKLPRESAELMIEEIGHVITPVDELRRTRRISALPADQELLAGKVYLLVPASRVHSKASEFEMAITEQWACQKKSGQRKKPIGNIARVSPSPVSTSRERDGENEFSILPATGMLVGQRLGNQGRWNPVLDPIFESSREFGQKF